MSAFQEHILNSPGVCNNCFGRRLRERQQRATRDPTSVSSAKKSAYERVETQTELGYGPSESMSESKGLFCECGVESAYHRIWEDGEDRCLRTRVLKDLLRSMIQSLEAKGVTLERKTCISLALQHYRDGQSVNDAFGSAVETAIQRSVASGAGGLTPMSD